MCAKNYENPTMLSRVTAKNVGDVFLRHTVVSKFLSIFNTLTIELLLLNCIGLHYATFSIVMHIFYSSSGMLVYLLSVLVIDIIDGPSSKCVK